VDLPLALTQEALAEYEQLWREDNPGKEPDRKTLADEARRTLNAVQLVYRPITADRRAEYEKLVKWKYDSNPTRNPQSEHLLL